MAEIYPPVGTCIYCGADRYSPGAQRKLAKEHIVPFGIGGDLILPEASCQRCESITGRIDSIALNNHLHGPRRHLGLRGRTPPNKQKSKLPVFVPRPPGRDEKVMIPIEDYPASLYLPEFGPASFYAGGKPQGPTGMAVRMFNYKEDVLREKYGITGWSTPSLEIRVFCRMLAKIAHSYAIAKLGLGGFEPLLTEALRDPDRHSDKALQFVGGLPPTPPDSGTHCLQMVANELRGTTLHAVKMRLFASLGMPTYLVIVGTKTGQKLAPAPAILA